MAGVSLKKVKQEGGAQDVGEGHEAPCEDTWGIEVEPGEWVRTLNSMETVFAWGGRHGCFNTVTTLWFTSPLPLHPHLIRHALTLLAQQVKVLQLHVSWRWLRLWFRRMKHVIVDFRVDDRAVGEVVSDLVGSRYNMERGPLWRARLVPLPAPPDRHRAVLVLAVHHTITDGLSNMILSRDLLHLINTTLLPHGPAPTLSPHRPIITLTNMVKPGDWPYILSILYKKMSTSILTSKNKTIYFGGALPCPSASCPPVPPVNRFLHTELSAATTTALLAQCRAAEVTMHAVLLAVAQVALVRVAGRRGGVDVAGTEVTICNCVNFRRYMPPHLAHTPGCFISLEDREVPASADDEKDVWGLVTRLNTSLRHSLGPGRIPVKNTPLLRMITLMVVGLNRALARMNRPHRCDSHIITTNMGNLSELLPGTCSAGPVQVAHMVRTVSSEMACNPFMLASHTFRGRLLLSLDYYTNKITPAAASQVFYCFVSMMTCLGNHGNLTHDGPDADTTCPNAHHDQSTFTYTTPPQDYHAFNNEQYFTCEDDHDDHNYDKYNYNHDHNHNQQDLP
ncbi:hypothetical protein Pcinc_017537 [Petrolisthes cinctipes]|uniref:Phthiocerol/phthiodiolone dimycocerosyl transferase C-terminal domain-containing protein n=1 Tax=Petrolisthes cinctipes TaxID=88211 RepID=A0AAE1FP08_PETCI|nr:hypothetical protein Pcinc_017537 [Petrolisthes cinctipes]